MVGNNVSILIHTHYQISWVKTELEMKHFKSQEAIGNHGIMYMEVRI